METWNEDDIVLPGDRLAGIAGHSSGPGTYSERDYIYATTTGKQFDRKDPSSDTTQVCVFHDFGLSSVPTTGSVVIAQITRIQSKFVSCDILYVNGCRLSHPYRGQIRLQDVRRFEVDKIEMFNCFRPTDIVRAKVISASSFTYLLSTSDEHMGVIFGESTAGGSLLPRSWQLMECSKTGHLEERHVAKPFPQHKYDDQ